MLARALAGLRKLWLAMFPVSLHSTRMRQLSVVWEVDKMPCMLKSVDWPAERSSRTSVPMRTSLAYPVTLSCVTGLRAWTLPVIVIL